MLEQHADTLDIDAYEVIDASMRDIPQRILYWLTTGSAAVFLSEVVDKNTDTHSLTTPSVFVAFMVGAFASMEKEHRKVERALDSLASISVIGVSHSIDTGQNNKPAPLVRRIESPVIDQSPKIDDKRNISRETIPLDVYDWAKE